MHGSLNFRGNSSLEQVVIENSESTYRFFESIFEPL